MTPRGPAIVVVCIAFAACGKSDAPTIRIIDGQTLGPRGHLVGTVGGGQPVAISGEHLGTVTRVTFGGVTATFKPTSDKELVATTPPHAAGEVAVEVTTPQGTASAPVPYRYVQDPVVSAVTPATGAVAGGAQVTVTGSGFTAITPVTSVMFGQVKAPSFVVVSDTTITVTTPPRPPGKTSIWVLSDYAVTKRDDAFTYVTAP